MKYAHLSDLHIGGWRDPKLRHLSTEVFLKAMDFCIEQNVDFILFSGDLFNTALPEVDKLNTTAKKLKQLKDKNIPVYVIPGSHDFSHSGKTMIDVLESAGLFTNVCKGEVVDSKLRLKFTIDKKTGAKITGMLGKKGMLDRIYYEDLDRARLEQEPGYKIFMFHTSITELKPKHLEKMDAYPVSLLPKGFRYYAGGHIHHKTEFTHPDYRYITYPGALFPNNFKEIESYGHGGLYIIDNDQVEWKPIKLKDRTAIKVDCDNKTPDEAYTAIKEELAKHNIQNSIVTLRLMGTLQTGKVSDIRFKDIVDICETNGAYTMLKNTSALHSKEYEEIKVQNAPIEEIESTLIKEHANQIKVKNLTQEEEINLTNHLMTALSAEKKEGETTNDFEERLKQSALKILQLE
jgi:DNA repair protein SbcD/Mre11